MSADGGSRFLGSGSGALARAAPVVRLGFGAGLIAACIAAPGQTAGGALLVAVLVVTGVLAAGTPRGTLLRMLGFGAALYLPMLLLLLAGAWITAPGDARMAAFRAAAPAIVAVAVKGYGAMLVALAAASTLRAAEIHSAFAALPLPVTARLILIQIAHQAGTLLDEAHRLRQVLGVRGAGAGATASVRLMVSKPQVWLAKLAGRAERVGSAMEVRGYGPAVLAMGGRMRLGPADAAWLGLAALAVVTAAALRAG